MMVDYNENEQNLKKTKEFRSLSAYVAPRLEPFLRKKGGFNARFLAHWPQIIGEGLAAMCTPFKIQHSRKRTGDEMPTATLFIACEGFVAVKIQHQGDEIIKRTNQFFGAHTIDKIKIVQKNLRLTADNLVLTRPLTPSQAAWLEEQNAMITDGALRASMIRLGKNIMERHKMP